MSTKPLSLAVLLVLAVGASACQPSALGPLTAPLPPPPPGCRPACPEDTKPCDPLAYKMADDRCERNWRD